MSGRFICRAALLCLLLSISTSKDVFGQFHFFAGAKTWYATWDLRIDRLEGVEQSDYSAALMFGPYLGFSVRNFRITGFYSKTVVPFEATSRNPGLQHVAFNANTLLLREDINIFLDYRVSPEIRLFYNQKYLKYTRKDALTYISGGNDSRELTANATGYGGGMQVTVPFRGGSPMYVFLSMGAVLNVFEDTDESESELLYFFDSGLGYAFRESPLGITVGIRMETGKDSKTIVGPTANIFVMF